MLPRIPALLGRTAIAGAALAAILISAPQAHAKVTKTFYFALVLVADSGLLIASVIYDMIRLSK
jgi:hypothetical protein